MKEIERRNLYQPQQVSQGFNPATAPDITPLLRENFRRQQADREANARMDAKAFEREEQLMKLRHAVEDRETEALLSFSKTGFEFVQGIREGQVEEERAQASALFYENMSAIDVADKAHDAAMAELYGFRDDDAEAANAAFQKGAPYEIVRRIRELSDHGKAAYMEEMAINAGTMYRQFQDGQLGEAQGSIVLGDKEVALNNPEDPTEFSGVLAHNRKEFIKRMGIYAMTPGLQAKAMKLMHAEDAKLTNEFTTGYNKEKGANDRQGAAQQFKNGSITAQQALDLVANTPGKNGKGSFGYSDAHKFFIDEAASLYATNPLRADAMIEEYGELELNGRKFKDIHDDKILDYHTKKREAIQNLFDSENKAGKTSLLQRKQAILRAAAENPEFTQADADNEIREYLKEAVRLNQPAVIPTDLTNMWQNLSAGAERLEAIMREQENKKNANALDPEEIAQLPVAVRDKYMKDAVAQQKARLGDIEPFLKSAEALVTKHPMVAAGKGLEGADISILIAADMKKLIRQDVIDGLKMDPDANVRQLAEQSLATHRVKFEKGLLDPNSHYYIGAGGDGERLFSKYLPSASDAASKRLVVLKQSQNLRQRVSNEGYRAFDDKLLIAGSFTELAKQVKDYNKTGILPAGAVQAAVTFGMNPFELLNRQIGVYNKFQQGDKLDYIQTFQESQQQVTGSLRRAVNFIQNGLANQTMVERLTNDRWPVRSALAQVVPAKGGLQGLTPQDYKDLAYVVSAEAARGTKDIYAVAASVLNRVADPRFPNTVREVMMADRQYEAVTIGKAYDDPELEAELSSPEGQRMIVGMLRRLQGRTDFKGVTQRHNMGPGDVLVDNAGNFFHYSGQTVGSGPWTGEKPTHYMKFISQE